MWLWIVLGVVGVVVVVIVAFVILVAFAMKRGLAKGNAELQTALATLEVAEISVRANECVTVAREKLGVNLDPDDWQASAKHLDDLLSNRELKRVMLRAFEKPGLPTMASSHSVHFSASSSNAILRPCGRKKPAVHLTWKCPWAMAK